MKFHETPLRGAFLIELEKRGDERGFFARFFCEREFEAAGLVSRFVQINTSLSAKRGTLRGLHYQLPPSAEVKLMRCLRGSIYDIIVDLRPDSPTYLQSFGAELTDKNRLMMYVPHGFAHGILTLEDETETLYPVSAFYAPEQERGIRYNDSALKIALPLEPSEISAKDLAWPDFDRNAPETTRLEGLFT